MIRPYFILILSSALLISCKEPPEKKRHRQDTVPVPSTEDTINPQKAVNREKLIIPGKQLGIFEINKNVEPVLKRLGKPDSGDAAMGKSLLKWNSVQNANFAIFTTREMGVEDFSRIKAIRTLSPAFISKGHIGVGSTLKEIRGKFDLEKAGEFHENGKKYRLFSSPLGISFEIDSEQRCHGLVITEKRRRPQLLYLPFYSDFKPQK